MLLDAARVLRTLARVAETAEARTVAGVAAHSGGEPGAKDALKGNSGGAEATSYALAGKNTADAVKKAVKARERNQRARKQASRSCQYHRALCVEGALQCFRQLWRTRFCLQLPPQPSTLSSRPHVAITRMCRPYILLA